MLLNESPRGACREEAWKLHSALKQLLPSLSVQAKQQCSSIPAEGTAHMAGVKLCHELAGFLQDLSEFRGGNDAEIVVVGILFKAGW